ncbi:MAG: hypothetical protein AAF499_18425 [Pseudomonadota bacterium]
MPEPEWLGTAFDKAIVSGSVPALLQFQRRVHCVQADIALRAAIERIAGSAPAQPKQRQVAALGELLKRGRSLATWHRLAWWLRSQLRADLSDAQHKGVSWLHNRAVHRRDKIAKRYRQWLSLPSCRRHRNTVVKALARSRAWQPPLEHAQRAYAQLNNQLDATAAELDALDLLDIELQGWSRSAAATEAEQRQNLHELRHIVNRMRVSRDLGNRLQQLLAKSDENQVWHVAGALQTQLSARYNTSQQRLSSAIMLLRLPLKPRFAANPAAAQLHG